LAPYVNFRGFPEYFPRPGTGRYSQNLTRNQSLSFDQWENFQMRPGWKFRIFKSNLTATGELMDHWIEKMEHADLKLERCSQSIYDSF
jgi:hypothetical protein